MAYLSFLTAGLEASNVCHSWYSGRRVLVLLEQLTVAEEEFQEAFVVLRWKHLQCCRRKAAAEPIDISAADHHTNSV